MKVGDLKNAIFLYNKGSGLVRSYRRKRIILNRSRIWGWDGEIVSLNKKRVATEVIENIARKKSVNTVVFCGGDGTIHSGLKSVMNHDLKFGIFPLGSGNVLARNLGISMNLKVAVDEFFTGDVKHADVGMVNGEPFLLSASVGVSADVMMMTKRKDKKLFGRWAYLKSIFRAITMPSRNYLVEIDGKQEFLGKAKGVWVVNVDIFGGVSVSGGGHISSGDLRVGVLTANGFWGWLEFVYFLLRGRPYESRFYKVLPGKKIDIAVLDGRVVYECDGTVKGKTNELQIYMFHKKARIIVPKSRLKKVVIFDFDGTLADTFPGFLRAVNNVFSGIGLPKLTETDIKRLRNMGAVGVAKELRGLGINLASFASKVKNEYYKENTAAQFFPGIIDMLKKLEGVGELGIVTSNSVEFVTGVINRNYLTGFAFIKSEKKIFGKGKALEKIIKERNYDKFQVIYVGDEARDVHAAKSAGIFSIGVSWGYEGLDSINRAKPDLVVSEIGQLESILVKWANDKQKTKVGGI